MRIATWNVNSVKQRLDNLQAWLAERRPTSCLRNQMRGRGLPREAIRSLFTMLQCTVRRPNGVAILSKTPLRGGAGVAGRCGVITRASSRRWFRPATACCATSIYLPNSSPPEGRNTTSRLDGSPPPPVALGAGRAIGAGRRLQSDFVSLTRNPAAWATDALYLPRAGVSHAAGSRLTDAVRASNDAAAYTRSGIIRPAPG